MMIDRLRVLGIGGLLAAMSVAQGAGEFAPPAEGPVAFRRDMVPLDVDAMAGLSQHLEMLARGLTTRTAAQRRGAAQMLALALALDPANSQARELIADYQQDRHKPGAGSGHLAESRKRISEVLPWLETPEAGTHGQALAACLKDVLNRADPERPEAAEQGAWAGWIPAISAYETQPASTGGGLSNLVPGVVPDPLRGILLREAQVHTMLWRRAGGDDAPAWVLAVAPLQMSAGRAAGRAAAQEGSEGDERFALVIAPGVEGSMFKQTTTMLVNLLEKHHPVLPAGCQISITSKELAQSIRSQQRQVVSAAAAVLASAALTGRDTDAIIIGQIDQVGSFKLPTGFWDQIYALGKGNGQRVVLPAEAAASLPSLLALEKIGFFLDYEVLLAANFEQLLDLTAKGADEPVAKTGVKFREMRDRIGSQDIRQYILNRFVRQRLGEILEESPHHFSARMLLLQASGNRPVLIGRSVLAAELRRALQPMDWLLRIAHLIYSPSSAMSDNENEPDRSEGSEFSSSENAKIDPTFDLCRSRVDSLERYADKNDRELVEQTRKFVSLIRSLEKSIRSRGSSSSVNQAIRSACGDLVVAHRELSKTLAAEAGDAPPAGNSP